MPLVQIDLPRALFEKKGTQISEEIHQAFIDSLEIPPTTSSRFSGPGTTASSSSTRVTAAWTGRALSSSRS